MLCFAYSFSTFSWYTRVSRIRFGVGSEVKDRPKTSHRGNAAKILENCLLDFEKKNNNRIKKKWLSFQVSYVMLMWKHLFTGITKEHIVK